MANDEDNIFFRMEVEIKNLKSQGLDDQARDLTKQLVMQLTIKFAEKINQYAKNLKFAYNMKLDEATFEFFLAGDCPIMASLHAQNSSEEWSYFNARTAEGKCTLIKLFVRNTRNALVGCYEWTGIF